MASRNQNRPPRSPSNKKVGATGGRTSPPFSTLNNRSDDNSAARDTGNEVEAPDCGMVEFTKEDVEALLNEKMKKGNPYDNTKKMEQMTDLIKRLKLCVRWYKKVEEGYIQEKEKLHSEWEAAEKNYSNTVLLLDADFRFLSKQLLLKALAM